MKLPIPTKWALFLVFLASSATADFTWWVDSSCDNSFAPGVFDKMMAESFETAQMVWDRVSRNQIDEPQAHETFRTLFGYIPGFPLLFQKQWSEFQDIVTTLPKFRKEPLPGEPGRMASEVRIYCDNDERMKLVADDKMLYPDLPADTPLNSQRNPEDQEWEDPINQVNILGIPTCKNNAIRNDGRFTAASTRGMRKRRDVEGEHPNRVSVTICDEWLNMAGRINTWEELRAPGKLFPTDLPGFLGGNAVDCIEFIGSQLMYHEMMHLVRFKREDEAYGIKPCVELTPMVASRNAESHAIFGGLVRTMEYKQKLVTDYPDTGHLTEDNAIPDRVSAPPPAKARRTTPLTCENRDGHIEGKRLVCTQFEA